MHSVLNKNIIPVNEQNKTSLYYVIIMQKRADIVNSYY